jgi:hypothetical protein
MGDVVVSTIVKINHRDTESTEEKKRTRKLALSERLNGRMSLRVRDLKISVLSVSL